MTATGPVVTLQVRDYSEVLEPHREHRGTGARNGDRIQLFGPGHRCFEFYRNHGPRIVPLLEVDDLDQASAELPRGGTELLGRPESDSTWTWLTFRIPDGNIHSLGGHPRSAGATGGDRVAAVPGPRVRPVGPVRLRTGDLTAQDSDLMPEHQDLRIL